MYKQYYGLQYAFFEKLKDTGHIYSIDKVVLNFSVSELVMERFVFALDSPFLPVGNVNFWISSKIGAFKYNRTFECLGGGSFWLALGQNIGGKTNQCSGRIEFNPNKIWFNDGLQAVLDIIRRFAKPVLRTAKRGSVFELVRFDLAIDIPQPRENFELIKDRRLYEEVRHSLKDRTQYLGARNKSGRVKLYNKQLEQELDEPLTRLEITVGASDSAPSVIEKFFPRLQDISAGGLCGAQTDTDNFILRTLIAEPERIIELSRRKREKMQALLDGAGFYTAFDKNAYKKLYTTLQKILQ